MREANFNTELTNSLKEAGAWAYKIADSPSSWTWARTRFTPEKPCDILFCFEGRFGAIESKQIKRWESFGLKSLRDSQIDHLDRISASGGAAFVALNVRIKAKRGPVRRGRGTGQTYENRLLVFEWSKWKTLFELLPLSAEELRAYPFTRGEKGLYDLSGLLKYLR